MSRQLHTQGFNLLISLTECKGAYFPKYLTIPLHVSFITVTGYTLLLAVKGKLWHFGNVRNKSSTIIAHRFITVSLSLTRGNKICLTVPLKWTNFLVYLLRTERAKFLAGTRNSSQVTHRKTTNWHFYTSLFIKLKIALCRKLCVDSYWPYKHERCVDLFISLAARKSTSIFPRNVKLFLLLLTKWLDLLDHVISFWPNNSGLTNYPPVRNYLQTDCSFGSNV